MLELVIGLVMILVSYKICCGFRIRCKVYILECETYLRSCCTGNDACVLKVVFRY